MQSLCAQVNAGTVEFMVEPNGNYYFLEVNPRIQVAVLACSTLGSVISVCRLRWKRCECTLQQ